MKNTTWLTGLLAVLITVPAAAQPSLQTLVSSGLAEPSGVAVDEENNYYVTDSANNRIVRFDATSGQITTFAGVPGEPGDNDGPGVLARFFDPQGIVAARGGFAVVDSGNHRIRFIAMNGVVTTLAGSTGGFADGAGTAARFESPAGIAADPAGNLYVADLRNGRIRRIDLANNVTTVASGLLRPSAVTVDPVSGLLYVAETGTHSIRVIRNDGSVELFAGSGSSFISGSNDSLIATNATFNSPRGLLWVNDRTGLLVSDTGNSLIRRVFFNTNSGLNVFSVERYVDGAQELLRRPMGLAVDNNRNFPLADQGNNALVSIQIAPPQPPVLEPQIGYVILTTNAFGQLRTALVPGSNFTFNNDVRVAILAEGGTETFYTLDPDADFPRDPSSRSAPPVYENGLFDWEHTLIDPAQHGSNVIIRAISRQDGRRSSQVVSARFQFNVAPPVIDGKNPGGFTMSSATAGARLYYTVDGSTPTEDSTLYDSSFNNGRLNIVNGTNDVTFKVRAYRDGFSPSPIIEKRFRFSDLLTTSIGVTRDFTAGVGSTILVPVEVKLGPGDVLRSLQFRFEVTPNDGAPLISRQLRYVNISTNDFIPIPLPSTNAPLSTVYSDDTLTGLAISFVGSTSGLSLASENQSGSAIVALIAVPIPVSAADGQSYTLSVVQPSGTPDGFQAEVPMSTFADRLIRITNGSYIVGDSARATWYNTGDFGDGDLNNNDVNNAFHASLGLFTPFSFTDVFDAMDAFPEDSATSVGGDGQIRFLDWQLILQRSLRLDSSNWSRTWGAGGLRTSAAAELRPRANSPVERIVAPPPGAVWVREVLVTGQSIENAKPGLPVDVPVYASVARGSSLSGLQFRASISAMRGAPPLVEPAQFILAPGVPNSRPVTGLPIDQVAYGWDLGTFNPPLEGRQLLGYIRFTVPGSSRAGQCYRLRFENADGAPDRNTQYGFESIPVCVWVEGRAETRDVVSDEWRGRFFGHRDAPDARDEVDADGDGSPNRLEYLAGTDPTNASSALSLRAEPDRETRRGLRLRWLTAPGKGYTVESSSDLQHWHPVGQRVEGDGNHAAVIDESAGAGRLFYRLRLDP